MGQAGAASWGAKGSMSRRFDKDSSSKYAAVRALHLCFLLNILSLLIRRDAGPPPKHGWQGRRGGRDGCYVPGSVRELGGDSGKNVTVGVASGASSRVL
jgi:hypothetical protein